MQSDHVNVVWMAPIALGYAMHAKLPGERSVDGLNCILNSTSPLTDRRWLFLGAPRLSASEIRCVQGQNLRESAAAMSRKSSAAERPIS